MMKRFLLDVLAMAAIYVVFVVATTLLLQRAAEGLPGIVPALVLPGGTKVYVLPDHYVIPELAGCVFTESKVMGGGAASVDCP